MLPAFIIEEILKQEKARREIRQQPVLELPIPENPPSTRQPPREDKDDVDRGVVIIQL